jgi:circadian clock protein KaiC
VRAIAVWRPACRGSTNDGWWDSVGRRRAAHLALPGAAKRPSPTQFIATGLDDGESCVVAVFEEYPEAYLARARTVAVDFADMIGRGRLAVTYLRPLDLSVDEMLAEIQSAVERLRATRVVIDSLSGFEVALAPTYRPTFASRSIAWSVR